MVQALSMTSLAIRPITATTTRTFSTFFMDRNLPEC